MRISRSKDQLTSMVATGWAFAMTWGENAFQSIFVFVMAAILSPHDFGILAIALSYIAFMEIFMDFGFTAALIQRSNLEPAHLDSVFWFNVASSCILMALTNLIGYQAESLSNLPDVAMVISALSITIPMGALALVQGAILKRAMNFKALSLRSNGSVLGGGVVGIIMAVSGFGVWALVAQQITKSSLALIFLWSASKWRPHMYFSSPHIRELLGFATGNLMAKLSGFISTQLDVLIMSIFLSPTSIGIYRLAQRIMDTVLNVTTNSLQVVSFPHFSQAQSNPQELKRLVLYYLWLSSILTIPTMAGVGVSSSLIVEAIGSQWVASADVLKLFSILGIAMAFTPFTGPLLQAVSKPKEFAILYWAIATIWIIFLAATCFALRNSDLESQTFGIGLARLASWIIIFSPLLVSVLMRTCNMLPLELARAVLPGGIASISAIAGVLITQHIASLVQLKPIVCLITSVTIGGLVTASTLLAVDSNIRVLVSLYVSSFTRRASN